MLLFCWKWSVAFCVCVGRPYLYSIDCMGGWNTEFVLLKTLLYCLCVLASWLGLPTNKLLNLAKMPVVVAIVTAAAAVVPPSSLSSAQLPRRRCRCCYPPLTHFNYQWLLGRHCVHAPPEVHKRYGPVPRKIVRPMRSLYIEVDTSIIVVVIIVVTRRRLYFVPNENHHFYCYYYHFTFVVKKGTHINSWWDCYSIHAIIDSIRCQNISSTYHNWIIYLDTVPLRRSTAPTFPPSNNNVGICWLLVLTSVDKACWPEAVTWYHRISERIGKFFSFHKHETNQSMWERQWRNHYHSVQIP